jgi:NAD(P)-dependent dehydrogenase (short-subunit alcohol dehydrogenase family)
MGRMAKPSEIADAVCFLASPRASYITAVNINMDGAQSPVVV